jgi:hypothetical protein
MKKRGSRKFFLKDAVSTVPFKRTENVESLNQKKKNKQRLLFFG